MPPAEHYDGGSHSFLTVLTDRPVEGQLLLWVLPPDLMGWTHFMKRLLARCLFMEQSSTRVRHAQRPRTLKNNSDSLLMSLRSEMSQWGLFWFFTSWNMSSRTNMLLKKNYNQRNPYGLWYLSSYGSRGARWLFILQSLFVALFKTQYIIIISDRFKKIYTTQLSSLILFLECWP